MLGWKGSAGSDPKSSVTMTLGPGREEKPGGLGFVFQGFFDQEIWNFSSRIGFLKP